MSRIYRYVIGYHTIKAECADIGRILTAAARKNIHIWNINKVDDITLCFCIYTSQLNNIIDIFQKNKAVYEIIHTYSLKKDLNGILKRKAFVTGFIIFLISIIFMSSFISDVDISGNETVSNDEIIAALEKSGFKKGMLRYFINPKEIQKNFMINYDKLSWIWIDIDGTKANISVKERVPEPEIKKTDDYCNCVASRDGIITEIMPRTGKQIVHVGDVVKKGDMLIGGISETKSSDIRYMHADGIVIARTWHEKSGIYNHTARDRSYTGNKFKKYYINIGKHHIPLSYKDKMMYNTYDFEEKNKKISILPKIYLPISFTIQTYYEIIEKEIVIDDEEVIKTAENYLKKEIEKELSDINNLTIIRVHSENKVLSDGNIFVKVVYECSENIAQYQTIQMPYNMEDE